MLPNRYQAGRATVWILPTGRFKEGLLSVSSVMPVTPENACLAPLLLSVLRRGTRKYPTLADVNRRLDYLWGTGLSLRSHYRGNLLVLGLSAELLDGRFLPDGGIGLTDGVLELMHEILFCPLLDDDGLLSARYVESEKELQCNAIRAVKNNPRAYAAERARALLYEGEPCGIPLYGTEEQTMAVTREELTGYWRRWTASLRPDCFYVGPMEAGLLLGKLTRAFGTELGISDGSWTMDAGLAGQMPAGRGAACATATRESAPRERNAGTATGPAADACSGRTAAGETGGTLAENLFAENAVGTPSAGNVSAGKEGPGCPDGVPATVRRVRETLEVSQSQLVIGLRCGVRLGDPDFYACAVMNELLGGSPVSRLFTYVREKLSLCYSCSSGYAALGGTVTVSCGLSAANRGLAEAEIFRQLESIHRGDFTPGELDAARKSLINAYRQLEDSPADLENYYYGRLLAGCRVSLRECREGFAAVTAGEVARAAGRLQTAVIYFLEGTRDAGGGEEDEDEEADV